MSYIEFINKAIELTIVQADNGVFYLEPLWATILEDNEMTLSKTGKLSRPEVLEVLKLEVEKRNTIYSRKNDVIEWIADTLFNTIEPAMLEEENELVKNLVEYMKTNHGLKEKEDNIIPFPTK